MDKECCGNPLRGCEDCPPRKLTFDEWYAQTFRNGNWYSSDVIAIFRQIWNTAQENK